MSTVIKEILSLINRIDEEATLHLETKLKLTTQIKDLPFENLPELFIKECRSFFRRQADCVG